MKHPFPSVKVGSGRVGVVARRPQGAGFPWGGVAGDPSHPLSEQAGRPAMCHTRSVTSATGLASVVVHHGVHRSDPGDQFMSDSFIDVFFDPVIQPTPDRRQQSVVRVFNLYDAFPVSV